MTAEEKKATEYADSVEEKKHWSDENDSNAVFTRQDVEEAYLAGLKENGVVWHDLQEDPNDLPGDDVVLVQAKSGGHFIALYYPEDGHWGIYNMMAETLKRDIVAWCNIPQFTGA